MDPTWPDKRWIGRYSPQIISASNELKPLYGTLSEENWWYDSQMNGELKKIRAMVAYSKPKTAWKVLTVYMCTKNHIRRSSKKWRQCLSFLYSWFRNSTFLLPKWLFVSLHECRHYHCTHPEYKEPLMAQIYIHNHIQWSMLARQPYFVIYWK